MGYVLLYVIQGSDSVSGPYIRRGAHPPPHRHRPRVPAKLTHNHATGFPWRPCRGSLLGRPLLRYPASRQWFDSDVSVMLHMRHTCQSLVNFNVDYFFSINYVKRGGTCFEEGCENSVPSCYVLLVAYKEESRKEWLDSGDNLTPNRGSVSSKFREMLVIKFKCHGINFVSGINVFFYFRVTFTSLTWKEFSY